MLTKTCSQLVNKPKHLVMDNYLLNVPGNCSSVFIVGFKKVKIDTLFTGFLYLNAEHGPKSTDFLFRNEIYPIRTQSQ